jgi:hypothetical protein
MQVTSVTPDSVEVLLLGPKREFYFFDESDISLSLRLFEGQAGEMSINLSPADFRVSDGITIDHIRPDALRIVLAQPNPGASSPQGK